MSLECDAGSHFDETGGSYVYTREAFGEFTGFQVGWMSWLTRVAAGAAVYVLRRKAPGIDRSPSEV